MDDSGALEKQIDILCGDGGSLWRNSPLLGPNLLQRRDERDPLSSGNASDSM